MRTLNFLPLIILLSFSCVHSQSLTRKALFLGNSYTYVNNLPQLLADMAHTTGDSIIFDSNTPGGYTLDQHFSDPASTGKIMAGGWDYVVMQEQSQLPSFEDYLSSGPENLSALIRQYNPCARKMFYMTWGRKNGDGSNCAAWPPVCTYLGMDSMLRMRYIEMATLNHAEVSPVGAVWRYIRQNYPTIELYQADESHPSEAGSYAAACSFYSAIFKKDPSLVTYDFTLSPSDAAIIRNAAKVIVFDSLPDWDFGQYFPVADFNYIIGSGINEVDFTNNSMNADSLYWDFGDLTYSSVQNPIHNYSSDGTYVITLTAFKCDLSQINQSTKQMTVTFCSHNPTIFPDSLVLCPNATDTLWTQVYDSYQWLDNGNVIPNETNQYLVPSNGSLYSVLTTKINCTELSPPSYVDSYSSGLVIFRLDSTSTSTHLDTLCMGDTLQLILNSNKPYGNEWRIQWFENGSPITVVNDDSLIVTSSGNYSVSVYHNSCPDYALYQSWLFTANFINCNIGVEENNTDPFLIVFPNPSENVVSITINRTLIEKNYFISDIFGRIILKGKFENINNRIYISDFNKGIYILQLEQKNIPAVKIIKS